MSLSKDSEKRDFIAQMSVLLEQNSQVLIDAGFDPTNRITQLKTELDACEVTEAKQKEAQAASMDATKVAQTCLMTGYNDASSLVSLIEGLLGKDNSLVRKIKKLRK